MPGMVNLVMTLAVVLNFWGRPRLPALDWFLVHVPG